MSIVDLAVFALVVGWLVSTWRWKIHYRDGWLCAFGLLFIDVLRGVIDPRPDIPGRALHTLVIAAMLTVVIRWWRVSGIPCRLHGHVWVTTATTPTSTIQLGSDDPGLAMRLVEKFATADAKFTYTCAVCRIDGG